MRRFGTEVLALDPLTAEQIEAMKAKERADQEEADDRFIDVLRAAGVPSEYAEAAVARLAETGFKATVRKGRGELSGTILCGSPNGIDHEALIVSQEWQPVEDPPARPWMQCAPGEHNGYGVDARCIHPEHAHLEQGWWPTFGVLHREKETRKA